MKKQDKTKKPVVWTLKKIRKIRREDGLKPKRVYAFTFRAVLDCVVSRYPKRLALCTYKDDETLVTYRMLGFYARNLAMYLLETGFRHGDRIALMGESSPSWMIAYLAMTSVGLTVVPILPDFPAKDVQNILEESKVKGIFVNSKHYEKCLPIIGKGLRLFRLEDLFEIPTKELPAGKTVFAKAPGTSLALAKPEKGWEEKWRESEPKEDDIASLIFTSGTTGKSKGVLLTQKNLVWNADVCTDIFFKIKPGYRFLSILPMSHVYEFTTNQILGLLCGGEIHYLGRPAAASVLMPALQEIRPVVMMSVPLLMEKVYKASVKPVFDKNVKIKRWLKWTPSRKFISRIVGRKLRLAFGGKLKFFGIGGAPSDPAMEQFLYDSAFPYAQGYGLTETSPMVAGHGPKDHHLHMIGKVIEGEEVRLDNKNADGVGEILVKGPNVMPGYYENPELNKECFTEDGFFRTGDLGQFDKHGRLGLRGRTKTMILGSGGENIYPENIEALINSQDFVTESLVVPEDGGLLALVKIDLESYAKSMKINIDDAQAEAAKYVAFIKQKINRDLSSYSKISSAELQEEPFQRTPTMKIKRFLYDNLHRKKNGEEKDGKDGNP